MKKIKIERSLKLRKEDLRSRDFNVITNNEEPESVWLNSYGGQKETFFSHVAPKIQNIHDDKNQISCQINTTDLQNEKSRVKMEY